MARITAAAFIACVGLSLPLVLRAHHSMSAEFDLGHQGELTGEISRVWFANPHVRYGLTVTNADGTTQEWELQAGNITNMRRAGWDRDTLRVGDRVTVVGDLGRDGAQKLRLEELTLADGRVVNALATGPREDPDAVHASVGTDYTYSGRVNDYPVDITGPWRNRYKWHVTVDDLDPKPTPFSAEGRRVFEATEPWDDPSLRCLAPGLPRVFGAPFHMDIIDVGSHYLIVYLDHNTPRRIWMDGRRPPATTVATSMGFSVGHWEDETLVIETTHLTPGWLDGSGLPMSGEGTRIVERYEPSADRLTMTRTMTIYDPYYTEPLVRHRASVREDNLDMAEAAGCDPASFYRDLSNAGRLEEYLLR